ncbi:MAG: FHA domain-containing protein [Deltaproteobacteria bacterium]|nr:FHA domain-containing protein [Deltaproteobacteria bacterium]
MSRKAVIVFSGGGEPEDRGSGVEAHLWVCSGPNIGRRFAIDRPRLVIGRSPAAEIPVVDERVSQQHARIELRDGRHHLLDLGSTNGTFVNNQRIEEHALKDGDLVQVGETVFEYLSYEERNLTITVGGSGTDEGVPPALRAGAREILQRARDGEVEPVLPTDLVSTQSGHRTQVESTDPLPSGPLRRPARGVDNGAALDPYAAERRAAYVGNRRDSDEEEEEGLDLRDLVLKAHALFAFFRPYWRSILALALSGAIIGGATYVLRPPARTAVFEVSLVPGVSDNPVSRFDRGNLAFFKSAEVNFRSSTMISKTLSELGEQPDKITAERLAELQGRLNFASVGPPMPNTYRGSFSAPSGEEAVKFLETHVKLYLESEIEKTLKVIKAEGDFLAEQLNETEKELRRTESELLEFKKENIDGLPEQARQYYDLLFDLKRQESSASMEIVKLRAELQMSSNRLRLEQPLVESQVRETQPYQEALLQVNRELADARSQGKDSEHPDVIQLERRKEELERLSKERKKSDADVVRRRNPNYDALQNELHRLEVAERVAQNESGRVKNDMARIKSIVDRLPELEATYSELTRSYDATKALHTRIFEQLKATQLQLELEKASAAARYDIITPPNLEYLPRDKAIAKRSAMGFMGGLFLGLGLATVRRLRHTLFAPPPTAATSSRALTRPPQ